MVCVFLLETPSLSCALLVTVLMFVWFCCWIIKFYLILVYRPPSNDCGDDALLIDFLLEFCTDKEVIIFGDFNMPDIDWRADDCLFVNYSPRIRPFIDCFVSLGIKQWVSGPTFWRSGNTLDLVFTSEEDRVGTVETLPPYPSCGHLCVLFTYIFQSGVDSAGTREVRRDWFKGRYGIINNHLSDFDWNFEFAGLSVSDMFDRLTAVLAPLISRYVSLSVNSPVPRIRRPSPGLKRSRTCAWQSYKRLRGLHGRNSLPATQALAVFDSLNDRFRRFFIYAQRDYEESLMLNYKTFPKRFHSYIRSKKVGSPSVGPLQRDDGSLTAACGEMAEIFADGFVSVYATDGPVLPVLHQVFDGILDHVPLTFPDVVKRLSSVNPGSSMGPDGMHPSLLRSCSSLATPLYLIFRKSLMDGVVPVAWTHSTIVPIFKKGSRHVALNYRPISLTSICSKTLERMVADCLYEYLNSNSLLSPSQFGFRQGRTVDDQLLLVYNDVSRWLDSWEAVDVVFFDFAKAFDTVSHGVLLSKLRHLGIGGAILDWLGDFLVGRTMSVSVSGVCSTAKHVTSKVPQGSVLGPLLFLVYVNFLPSSIVNKCMFFADDLKIYLNLRYQSCVNLALDFSSCQQDIDSVAATAESWGLRMNAEKCSVLRLVRGSSACLDVALLGGYTVNGTILRVVTSQRDLGVLVDSTLRFHSHIASVVSRAGGLSMNLLRSTLCRSADFMLSLFVSHIRPLLDFASPVWNTGYLGDLHLLESVQRRWTKNIDGMTELSYAHRLEALNLYSIKGRLLRADLLKCWKIFYGKCGIQPTDLFVLAPDVGTRGHRFKLRATHSSLECRRRFFLPALCQ